MDEALRRQEPEIRDILIALLEKQTMESLGRPGIRDSLKEAIADTVTALAKSPRRLAVFLPQFVIQ
jgi:flagellar basal body-associated protein FliL